MAQEAAARVRAQGLARGRLVTDLFRCESCGAAEARIHRTIRAGRAAVDRAATYATCKCGNRWEV